MKELKEKSLIVRIEPSLFLKFKNECNKKYISSSQAIRNMIVEFTGKNHGK